MFKVAFRHFVDDTARDQRSGWYIIDEADAIVPGTSRFECRASAVRAVMALLNVPAFA